MLLSKYLKCLCKSKR